MLHDIYCLVHTGYLHYITSMIHTELWQAVKNHVWVFKDKGSFILLAWAYQNVWLFQDNIYRGRGLDSLGAKRVVFYITSMIHTAL